MKKNSILFPLAILTALIGFNVIAFVAPFNHTATFWTAYIFTTIAMVVAFAGSRMSLGNGANKTFLGMPIAVVLWSYFIAQFVIGIILMIASSISVRAAILVCAVPLIIVLLMLIACVAGNEHVEKISETAKEKRFYLQSLVIDIENMASKTDDAELRKKIRELAETARYSDPMSSDQLISIESKISSKVAELDEIISAGDYVAAKKMCVDIISLFIERNKKVRLLK